MPTIQQILASAVEHHQAGLFQNAEQGYRQILQQDPNDVNALHLMGVLCFQQGNNKMAIDYINQALRRKPDFPEAYNNLGNALREQGRLDEAVASFQHALQLQPNFANAHYNLANARSEQGRLDAAVASFQQALRLQPGYVEAHNNLGIALMKQGRVEEAMASYQRALRLKPDFAETHNNLGIALMEQGRLDEAVASYRRAIQLKPNFTDAHNNLGNAFKKQGRLEEAVASYRQVLLLRMDHAQAYNNLGIALAEQGQLEEAMASYHQALHLQPNFAEAHNNVGNALMEQGRLEEAVASIQQALRLKPDFAEAYNNLGMVLKDQGRVDEAVASYQHALHLQPDSAEVYNNLAMARLLLGNFEQGWLEYEWRWKCKGFSAKHFREPPWDGSPLEGQRILLYAEQGLGDTLHFIRYAPLVKQRGGTVLVECQAALVPLLSRCPGIDQVVAKDSMPKFDVHAALLSLPGIFGTTLASVPAQVPYLFADPGLTAHWARELKPFTSFNIGIAWQGNLKYPKDRQRSFPLALFEPLARLEGVQLFSLQKGPGTDQLQQVADRFTVIDLGSKLDEKSGAFMDTAAVMKSLDLVITPETSIAQLAGALGVPVWVALAFVPDWRWLLHREDSPWYPTMRLFRQTARGNWPEVFERIAAEVKLLTTTARTRPVTVVISPGELIDKITILEIKNERLADAAKLGHVRAELGALRSACTQAVAPSEQLQMLTAELKAVNEALWEVEDEIRLCERNGDFGVRFTELARSVYRQNDLRAALKRRINDLLGSEIVEEKSYTPYA